MQNIEKRMDMLVKRMEKLEGSYARGYNSFIASKERIIPSTLQEMSFYFIAESDAYLPFKIIADCDNVDCSIEVTIDGAKSYASQSFSGSISFIAPVCMGEKRVDVKLQSMSDFVINRLTIEINGCLKYPKKECFLTVINDDSRSTVCYCYDGELLVKRYIDRLFETVVQKTNVKCGTICKVGNAFALFYVNYDGVLKLEYLSYDDYTFMREGIIDQDVSSVCAFSGESALVFSVKGNRIYRYVVDLNCNQTTQITQFTARRITNNPSIPGYIIATDFAGNGKIINIE